MRVSNNKQLCPLDIAELDEEYASARTKGYDEWKHTEETTQDMSTPKEP